MKKRKKVRKLTPWQKLVSKYGVKGAKERYKKIILKAKSEPETAKDSLQPTPPADKEEKVSLFIDRGVPLKERYGETKIALLPRDPRWIYAYWEIAEAKKEEVRRKRGEEIFSRGSLTLRFYDVTDIVFNGRNAHKQFDVKVYSEIGNWYFQVPESGRTYLSDIGLLTAGGEFITLARSNPVSLPQGKISEIADEKWMIVKEEFEELIKEMQLDKSGLSTKEAMKILSRRLEEILPLGAGSPIPTSRKPK
ncbi:hypothetical protein ES705_03880 [subsurface metagenome]|nr:DUF4912 domain-containing protein [Clostridia bacterium]